MASLDVLSAKKAKLLQKIGSSEEDEGTLRYPPASKSALAAASATYRGNRPDLALVPGSNRITDTMNIGIIITKPQPSFSGLFVGDGGGARGAASGECIQTC